MDRKNDCYLISAIVSSYNSEKFLPGCLEDLESQTIADRLEIIVVDSGSEQNERMIVEGFRKRYGNIVYIRTEERETVYAAWNRAIRASCGKYITNANTDDRHRPDAFELMSNLLETRPDIALVYADADVTLEENMPFGRADVISRLNWPEFDNRSIFQMCYIGPQPMWRCELHSRYGYFDPEFRSAGDYEFWLRIAKKEKFLHIPESLGLYLLSPASIEGKDKRLSHSESELARQRHWPAELGGLPSPISENAEAMVSVIVPTFNRPDSLVMTLNSILTQTHRNIEVVVINDGGADVSGIISRFKSFGDIVYISSEKKRGPAAARNIGLKKARGKYIAYLDDDDIYYPNHLELLVGSMEAGEYKVAYSNSHQAFQKRNGDGYATVRKKACGQDFDRERLLIKDYIPILTVMHSRDCIEEAGLFDEGLGVHEDWDLLIRMSQHFDFCHINALTAEFRTREGADSITSKDFPSFLQVMKKIHARYAGYATDPKTEKSQKAIVSLNEAKIEQQDCVRTYAINPSPGGCDASNSKVSIVMSAKTGDEGLKRLTEKIAAQKKIGDVEIIVITGDPDRVSGRVIKENGKNIRFVHEMNDYGRTLNNVIAGCGGEYIVFTGQDTVPASNYWLYSMVRPFLDHPELAALSCRRVVKPEDELFSLWKNKLDEQSQYYRSDSICVLSGSKNARWRLFDKETKTRLTYFDGRSSCARRKAFDEIRFTEMKGAGEVYIDFGTKLLERRKAVGYIISSGVYCLREESAADLLKKAYRRTKMLHNYINGLPCFFHINNIGSEDVRSDVLLLYYLINASIGPTENNEAAPIRVVRSFLENLTREMDGYCEGANKKGLQEKALDELMDKVAGRPCPDLRGEDRLKNNFMLPDFISRFESFSEYLCTTRNSLEGRHMEFISCIYKIFAELAGEAFGAFYLEAGDMNNVSEDIREWEKILLIE